MLLYKLFSQGEQSGDNGATKWPIIGQTGYTHTHAHTRSRTQEKLGMARGCLFRKEARLYIWSANVPSFFFFLGRANKVNMGKRRKEEGRRHEEESYFSSWTLLCTEFLADGGGEKNFKRMSQKRMELGIR